VLLRILFSFILLISFAAISWGQEVSITSNPSGADIYVRSSSEKEGVKIGKTPFKMPLGELINNYVKTNTFVLELKKDSFTPYRVLLAKTATVDIDLVANLDPAVDLSRIKEYDRLISDLFEVQRLIRSKNNASAITSLDELEKKFPEFSIIPELKGTAYYLDKQVDKALSFYRRAFTLNPENVDSYKMKVYLEKSLGIKSDIKK